MPQKSQNAGQHFTELVQAIVSGDGARVADFLNRTPTLVHERAATGATRNGAPSYFFEAIRHYLYAGDTALHMAAAAFKPDIAQSLIDRGADCSMKNRRGAEPLHYASDCNVWSPTAQAATIHCLIHAGADPVASDKGGVQPLHRAVRTRCAATVEALLAGGAMPRARNGSGSTPLHLAVQNTGRGGSGTEHAIEQQRQIIMLLLNAGAKPEDRDGKGKTVHDVATADWIRALLVIR